MCDKMKTSITLRALHVLRITNTAFESKDFFLQVKSCIHFKPGQNICLKIRSSGQTCPIVKHDFEFCR